MKKIIPLQDCKDRYLYKIFSRNFNLGVFDAENRDFIGIRNKCGETFLDRENYSLGCVKVYEEIEKIPEHIFWTNPVFVENKELFNYLKEIKWDT